MSEQSDTPTIRSVLSVLLIACVLLGVGGLCGAFAGNWVAENIIREESFWDVKGPGDQ